jgi:ketosteroid isomerase-like protein
MSLILALALAAAPGDKGADQVRALILEGAKACAAGRPEQVVAHYSRDIVLSYPGIPDQNYSDILAGYRRLCAGEGEDTVESTVPTFHEVTVMGQVAIARLTWTTRLRGMPAGATRQLTISRSGGGEKAGGNSSAESIIPSESPAEPHDLRLFHRVQDVSMSDSDVTMDQATHERIVALYHEGDKLVQDGLIGSALGKYGEAWSLIPEPRQGWKISTPLISAIADCWFLAGKHDEVLRALEFGMNCPDAIGNPFLHLRLGQALLEQGQEDRAADELMRAYEAHGEKIFAQEDPKYLAFLVGRGLVKP